MATLSNYVTTAVTCLNPQVIYNKHLKEQLVVPCGKCCQCLNTKAVARKNMCNLEQSSHKYCFFITLTYDNEHIPTAKFQFNEETNQIDIFNITHRNYNDIDKFTSVNQKSYGALRMLSYKQKATVNHKHDIEYLSQNTLYYANKKDLQKYVKRVRFQVYKQSREQIRFYAVSEYGPKSFRPHFHLLFYFDKPETLQIFRRISLRSWKYGNSYSELSQSSCSSYVSGYLNSFLSLPTIFKTSHFKPFCSHSKYFGVSYLQNYKDDIYQNTSNCFNGKSYSFPTNLVSIYRTKTLENTFFPKTFRFSEYSDADIFKLFKLYRKSVEELGYLATPSECMPLINTSNFKYEYQLLQLSNNWEDIPTLVSRVYNSFLTSYHFYNFICNADPFLQQIRFNSIKSYYIQKSLQQLSKFYQAQCDYALSQDNPDFSLFYPDISNFEKWKNKLKQSYLYKLVFHTSNDIANQSIKHKELNDLNGLLISTINKLT